jgi:hypothetical protein
MCFLLAARQTQKGRGRLDFPRAIFIDAEAFWTATAAQCPRTERGFSVETPECAREPSRPSQKSWRLLQIAWLSGS